MTTLVLLIAAAGAGVIAALPSSAQTIIEEWGSAKFPPPPQLKPATIVPKETAVLAMDFTRQTCTVERRKRCADSVPKVLKLITEARGKGALIVYSVAVPNSVPGDILPELTPAAGEQVLPPLGPDKFIGSDLEQTLKDKGIKTVIAIGTQAQTSVLHTGAAAALRGFCKRSITTAASTPASRSALSTSRRGIPLFLGVSAGVGAGSAIGVSPPAWRASPVPGPDLRNHGRFETPRRARVSCLTRPPPPGSGP
jgi:hypothetical protein